MQLHRAPFRERAFHFGMRLLATTTEQHHWRVHEYIESRGQCLSSLESYSVINMFFFFHIFLFPLDKDYENQLTLLRQNHANLNDVMNMSLNIFARTILLERAKAFERRNYISFGGIRQAMIRLQMLLQVGSLSKQ